MKKFTLLAGLLSIISSMLAFNSNAEIYTWVDEDGKTHFSDKPTESSTVSTIKPEVNNNISEPVSSNSQWQQDYNTAKEKKYNESQEQEKIKAKSKNICEQAKKQLILFKQGGRIYIELPNGERDYQSDEQQSDQTTELTNIIKKYC